MVLTMSQLSLQGRGAKGVVNSEGAIMLLNKVSFVTARRGSKGCGQ